MQTANEKAKKVYEADPTDFNQNHLNEASSSFICLYLYDKF